MVSVPFVFSKDIYFNFFKFLGLHFTSNSINLNGFSDACNDFIFFDSIDSFFKSDFSEVNAIINGNLIDNNFFFNNNFLNQELIACKSLIDFYALFKEKLYDEFGGISNFKRFFFKEDIYDSHIDYFIPLWSSKFKELLAKNDSFKKNFEEVVSFFDSLKFKYYAIAHLNLEIEMAKNELEILRKSELNSLLLTEEGLNVILDEGLKEFLTIEEHKQKHKYEQEKIPLIKEEVFLTEDELNVILDEGLREFSTIEEHKYDQEKMVFTKEELEKLLEQEEQKLNNILDDLRDITIEQQKFILDKNEIKAREVDLIKKELEKIYKEGSTRLNTLREMQQAVDKIREAKAKKEKEQKLLITMFTIPQGIVNIAQDIKVLEDREKELMNSIKENLKKASVMPIIINNDIKVKKNEIENIAQDIKVLEKELLVNQEGSDILVLNTDLFKSSAESIKQLEEELTDLKKQAIGIEQ